MRRRMAVWPVLALALSAPAWAARTSADAIDCHARLNPVEKLICSDSKLNMLDAELGGIYAARLKAYATDAQALRRDQRNWLAERDDQIWSTLSEPVVAKDAKLDLARIYRQRIGFLLGMVKIQPGAVQGSIWHALLDAMQSMPAEADDVLRTVSKSSALVELPPEQHFDSVAALLAHLPGAASVATLAVLRKRLDTASGPQHPQTLVWLPQPGIGGSYALGGSADCATWTLLFGESGSLQLIDTPKVLAGNCWNTTGYMAMINRLPVAISETQGIVTSDSNVQWQLWRNRQWHAPQRLMVRFDRKLQSGASSCLASFDCAGVSQMALNWARRYDAKPLPGTLPDGNSLNSREQVRFRQMRALAQTADTVKQLPQIGKRVFGGLDGYGKAAIYFPVHWHGKLLLGRIGHGYIGWRESGSWLVGLWRLDHQTLESVAGVVIERKSAGVLTAARLTPQFHHF